jgi:hypothetical protein
MGGSEFGWRIGTGSDLWRERSKILAGKINDVAR